jgi:hypothetical protein
MSARRDRRRGSLPYTTLPPSTVESQPHRSVIASTRARPIVDGDSGLLGVSLFSQDVTATRRMLDYLRDANRQLETA